MDLYTELTKAWLDRRYRDPHGFAPGVYFSHEPIYGIGVAESEPNHARRLVRLFQLLKCVRKVGGSTLLDVGGSEGYFACLCRELFGMTVVSVDLSEEACRRAAEIFTIPSCAVDAAVLPFATGAFDVVVCAEVVEHLVEPVPAVLELQRVAARALVLSTEEWEESAEHRDRVLAERELSPHGDRSIFADIDLKPLFTPYQVTLERQIMLDGRLFGDDRSVDRPALRAALLDLSKATLAAHDGAVLSVVKDATPKRPPKFPTDAQIIDHLLQRTMPVHRIPDRTPIVPWPKQFGRRCVLCARELRADDHDALCACGERYACQRGVISFQRSLRPFTARVDEMLRERGGPGYAEQKRDLVALAGKLALELKIPTAWDFTTSAADAWEPNDSLERQQDGSWRVVGPDPGFESPLIGISGSAAGRVVIEFGATSEDPAVTECAADLFWMEEGESSFTPGKSASVRVPLDGVVREHVFVAPKLGKRRLVKLRFDPVDSAKARIVVRSIAFKIASAWDFRTPAANGWLVNSDLQKLGNGRFRAVGPDPRLESPLVGVSGAAAGRVVVELGAKGADPAAKTTTADMFWMEEGDVGFTAAKSASVTVPLDGIVREYVFVAPKLAGKRLLKLRFDPVTGTKADLEVRSVRFKLTTAWDFRTAAAESWTRNADLEREADGTYRVVGPDPRLESPLVGLPGVAASRVVIEFGAKSEDPAVTQSTADLFWREEGDATFTAEKCASVAIPLDGVVREHVFVAPNLAGKRVFQLRFDPVTGTKARVTVRSVRFKVTTAWDFKPSAPDVWRGNAEIERRQDGSYRVLGPDPRLESPLLGVSGPAAGRVVIEFGAKSEDPTVTESTADLFWREEGDATFTAEKSASLTIPLDGVVREHVFLARNLTGKRIFQLRFDPVTGTKANVVVRSVRFKIENGWDFRTRAADLFRLNEDLVRERDGSYRVHGPDPRLESPLVGLPAVAASRVVIEYGARSEDPSTKECMADLFWMEEGDAWFSTEKCASIMLPLDGVVREHLFVAPKLTGKRVVKLRFDPVTGTKASVVVRSLRFQVTSSWDFRTAAASAWRTNDDCERQADGSHRVFGPDPWFESPVLGLPNAVARRVVIEFGAKSEDPAAAHGVAEVFWMEHGDTWFTTEKRAALKVPLDGVVRRHVFEVPKLERQHVYKLRFDPVANVKATVVVHSIAIV